MVALTSGVRCRHRPFSSRTPQLPHHSHYSLQCIHRRAWKKVKQEEELALVVRGGGDIQITLGRQRKITCTPSLWWCNISCSEGKSDSGSLFVVDEGVNAPVDICHVIILGYREYRNTIIHLQYSAREMKREDWNNAACHHGQWTHIKIHAPKRIRIWWWDHVHQSRLRIVAPSGVHKVSTISSTTNSFLAVIILQSRGKQHSTRLK